MNSISCIETEFAKHSLDLENELDTLETLFLKQGLINSAAPEDYRNYYQNNIDQGTLISLEDPYLRILSKDLALNFEMLECSALRKFDGETYDQSKFAKISHMIDTTVRATG